MAERCIVSLRGIILQMKNVSWSRSQLLSRLQKAVILLWVSGLITGTALTSLYFGNHDLTQLVFGAVTFLISVAVTWYFIRLIDEIDPFIKGIEGETKVDVMLGEMWPEGVRHLNCVVLKKGHGDIDHIAIAKTGVWVIETKNIDGKITMVNGCLARDGIKFEKNYLKQTFAEAKTVQECLTLNGFADVPVRPILVFVGHSQVRFGQRLVQGIFVISSLGLRKMITDQNYGEVLTSSRVEKIMKLLENSNI